MRSALCAKMRNRNIVSMEIIIFKISRKGPSPFSGVIVTATTILNPTFSVESGASTAYIVMNPIIIALRLVVILSKCESAKVIAYKELGPEAIRKLEVKDFPLIVGIDSKGGSIYAAK